MPSRDQRRRARALWAFLVAAIGLCAVAVGLGQYLASGEVSMLPGRDSVKENAALISLAFLFFTSAAIGAVGLVMRRRAKRGGSNREDG